VTTSDKPDEMRPTRKRLEMSLPPVLRRGRENRIVRWIGAGGGRPPEVAAAPLAEAPAGQLIRLSWADTFGRPVRPQPPAFIRSAPAVAEVLPFPSRTGTGAALAASRRAGDQPSVPVLR
jgi:hypothetical protein